MTVLHAISVGLSERRAASIALAMAAGSCPSIFCVAQPDASKRLPWSSDTASDVGPSIEIWLSSKRTISLLSFRCPASEIASWLMPSMRQPSPART